MSKTRQAIRPNFFKEFRDIGTLTTKVDSDDFKDEDGYLYNLSVTRGWQVLNDYIISLGKQLDDLHRTKMESGADFEAIGQNAVVVELAKEFLLKIITKVDDAKQAFEERQAREQARRGSGG